MAKHSGTTLATRDNLTVIDCKECGYAHLETMPTNLDEFYRDDFWQEEKPGSLARIQEQEEWWRATYSDWLWLLRRHTEGELLMDVGAGFGLFVSAADELGWRAMGIEPSEEAVSKSFVKNLVRRRNWNTTGRGSGWNVLSALWLVEHLIEPREFLAWAHETLRPGGLFLVAVPNEWTPAQASANNRVTRKNWWLDKTHVNYFDKASLANLLGRSGFRVVEWQGTYPVENWITEEGRDYVDSAGLGRELHAIVEKFDLQSTQAERLAYYGQLGRLGQGRDIIAVCVKE